MTVSYEIIAVANEDLAADYERYMTGTHIPDLMATGHFTRAVMDRSEGRYRIRYEAHSQEELDIYLAEDAPRLRSDFAEHFPTGVEVSREVWESVAEFQV